jgi:glycosyltransferase involved in cell wall biosynthesis
MKNYNISLLIPVYNDVLTIENVIQKAIKIIKPITNNFEIIVIDDSSPDNSFITVQSLIKKNKFIKLMI